MKYICNRCAKVFQSNDITINYKTGDNRLETVAICHLCIEDYLRKTEVDTDRKDEYTERMKRKQQ